MFLPFNSKLRDRARELRKNMTEPEKKMWFKILSNKQTEYRFLRQKPIAHFIVDFYCSELRLVVEIDGDSHAEQVKYDAERTNILEGHGLQVIRYENSEVLHNIEGVHADLIKRLQKRKRDLKL